MASSSNGDESAKRPRRSSRSTRNTSVNYRDFGNNMVPDSSQGPPYVPDQLVWVKVADPYQWWPAQVLGAGDYDIRSENTRQTKNGEQADEDRISMTSNFQMFQGIGDYKPRKTIRKSLIFDWKPKEKFNTIEVPEEEDEMIEIKEEECKLTFCECNKPPKQLGPTLYRVRYLDNHLHDVHKEPKHQKVFNRIFDLKCIKPYCCPEKLRLIEATIERFPRRQVEINNMIEREINEYNRMPEDVKNMHDGMTLVKRPRSTLELASFRECQDSHRTKFLPDIDLAESWTDDSVAVNRIVVQFKKVEKVVDENAKSPRLCRVRR